MKASLNVGTGPPEEEGAKHWGQSLNLVVAAAEKYPVD